MTVTERDVTQLNAVRDTLEETRMTAEEYRDKLTEPSISELKIRISSRKAERQEPHSVRL